jgi:ATP-dependent RNA helicase RhlE
MDDLKAIQKAMNANIPVIGGEPHAVVDAPRPGQSKQGKRPHRGHGGQGQGKPQGQRPRSDAPRKPARAADGGAARPHRRGAAATAE